MNSIAAKTEKALLMPYLRVAGKVLLVTALSRAQIAGTYPLGLAYAAALAEENAFAALAGLVIGAAWSMETAIKYIPAAIIYGMIVYLRKFKVKQVKAVALGAATAMSSLVTLFWLGATPARIIILLPEAFAAGGLYLLFGNVRNRGISAYAAEMLIAGGCFCSIYGLRFPYLEMNIAVFSAMTLVMCASLSCGIPLAALTGAVLGFLTFMNTTAAVEMCGLFSVSAIIAALAAKTGKTGVSAGFLTGATVCVLCMGRLGELNIADIFAAPILFLLIPQKTAVKVGAHINGKFRKDGDAEFNERVKTVAKAVDNLASGVRIISGKKGAGFDTDISARVCKDCKNAGICMGEGKDAPPERVKRLTKIMERDGYLDMSNAKPVNSCVRAERFLNEFLHMKEMEKQNELLTGEMAYDRELVAKQYGEISDMINSISETADGEKEVRYSVSVSVCQEAKKGQEINGDTVIHFQKGSKYFVILCDGMGSGAAAREISGLTAQLFAEFFNSGIEKETAVDMINSALALNIDRESFSSADILEIELSTGEAEFLKVGSAQSFIKRRTGIEEVSSSALPVGILESIEVKPQKYVLEAGDEILMITDGIGEAGNGVFKNEWIKKLFSSVKGTQEERAKQFLEGAKARTVFSDDMTDVIIRLKAGK